MRRYVSVVALLICMWCQNAVAQAPLPESKTAEKGETWSRVAMATWAKFQKSERTDSEYIPFSCWTEQIRSLDPVYVYHHRLNIVVVLKRGGETEEGLYIQNPVSSFLMFKETDGFSLREANETGLRRFVRQRSANQQVDGARP